MPKNHLTDALLTFWKHEGSSATHVAGLALSISVWLPIILFVREQKNYDPFDENAARTLQAALIDPVTTLRRE